MFRCYCKSIASDTYDTFAYSCAENYLQCKSIVSAFLIIWSYFMSSEITKSFTKFK